MLQGQNTHLLRIPALVLYYKMTQSHNTILIARLAVQSGHTGLIGDGRWGLKIQEL